MATEPDITVQVTRKRNMTILAAQIYNSPLAITNGALDLITSGGTSLEALEAFLTFYDDDDELRADGDVGIVKIRGSLYKGMFWNDMDDIREHFDAALEQYQAVVLDIDSPGGTTSGMLDLSDHIYNARGAKPIIALANETMASAAYVIGSAADRVFGVRGSNTGSLGVLARHVDRSKANAQNGFVVTEIASGEEKTKFSPNKPLSKSAAADLKATVDEMAEELFETVARNRAMGVDDIRAQKAGTFLPAEAESEGLIDGVRTLDEVIEEARNMAASGSRSTPRRSATSTAAQKEATMAENENTQTESVAAAVTTPATSASVTDIAAARTAAKQEDAERIAEVKQLCEIGGLDASAALDYISGTLSLAEIRKDIVQKRADGQAAATSSAPSGGADEINAHQSADAAASYSRPVIDTSAIYARRKKAMLNAHARNPLVDASNYE